MKQCIMGLLAAVFWMVNGALVVSMTGCSRMSGGEDRALYVKHTCKGEGVVDLKIRVDLDQDHITVTR